MFDVAVICLALTALVAHINQRLIALPSVIGVMTIALLLSIARVVLDQLGISGLRGYEMSLLSSIDFRTCSHVENVPWLLAAGLLVEPLDTEIT